MKKYKKLNAIMASVCFVLFFVGAFGSGIPVISSLILAAVLTGFLWFSIWISQSQEAPPLEMRDGSKWDEYDELTKKD